MFCPKCGFQNAEDSKYCQNCGEPLIDSKPAAPQKPKKKMKKGWKALIIVLASIIVLVGGFLAYVVFFVPPVEDEADSYEFSSIEDIVAACEDIPYNELLRNPVQHMDDLVHFSGQIVEVTKETEYIVALNDNTENLVKFDFEAEDDSRLLKGDWVEMYGKFTGLYTYKVTFLGFSEEETIPGIEGYYVHWESR